jgi:hypothetical protein
MKISFLTPLLVFLVSFTSGPSRYKEILYKSDKGTLSIEKDMIKANFDIDYYRRGEGDYVEILVLLDKKVYLGSEDEQDFKYNKQYLTDKYQKEVMKRLDSFDYSKRCLRVEKKNRRCYFFYYQQLTNIEIGRRMSDGRFCVGANNLDFQVKEKNIIVTLYLNGVYKYGEKIVKDKSDAIISRKNFTLEHLKTAI